MFQRPFDYVGPADTHPGEKMGLAIAARPRFLSMMIGLLLLATATGEANAKDDDDAVPPACEGRFADIAKDVRKRDATAEKPATVELAEYVFGQQASADVIETVKDACWDAAYDAREKTFYLKALECVGDAAAAASDLGKNKAENDLASYCAFDAMATLADRELPEDKASEAASQAGRAAALVELRKRNRKDAAAYGKWAVEAYERSIAAQPDNQENLFALASLYIALEKPSEAEDVISKLQGGRRALALVSLSQLKRRKKEPLSDILAVLNRASQAEPKSQTVNSALGVAHYESENLSQARDAFLAVIDDDAIDDAGKKGPQVRADAYYYLAVLDARTARNSKEWGVVQDNARRAYDIIGGDTRYRRLLCLAYIGKGFYKMPREQPAPFCEGKESAEGKLLYGLYRLRKAQYVPVRLLGGGRTHPTEVEYRDHLAKAEEAFSEGAKEIGPRQKGAKLEWPGLQLEPGLESTLNFGEDVVQWASTFCRSTLDKTDKAGEVAFFERYNALGCKP